MRWLTPFTVLVLASPAFPCLVFCVSDGKHVFAGNNEDWSDSRTRMWVVPGEEGKHGCVFFGYHDGYPQGGVNDAGLFFDGLALDHEPVRKSDKPKFEGHAGDLALATCTTVAEVVELFEKHDRALLSDAQLFFGDKTGDGVVFEGNAVVRKKGPYLLATNFRQSGTPPEVAGCGRYDGASRLLESMREASVDACRRILATTHQEGEYPTVYSNVYDLANGKIHLYHFHDFDNPVVIDVAAEIAKGAHTVELESLFPETYAFATFRRQSEDALMDRREKERDRTVDPKTFDDFVGRYRVNEGEHAGFEFRVRREKDKLFGDFEKRDPVELIPRGGDVFVCIPRLERAELTFGRNRDGKVQRVRIVQRDVELRADRVE